MFGRKRKLKGWSGSDTVVTILCVLLIMIVFYPLWYVFINSISNVRMVTNGQIRWYPVDMDFDAYLVVFTDFAFWRSILVTIFLAGSKTLLILYSTVVVAYPLVRKNLKFRKLLVAVLIGSMYIDGGLIPNYILMTKLHLYNTVWALILPGCLGVGNVMLLRVYMKSVGTELMDAAFVDGATNIQTLTKVMVPLCKPCLAVIALQTIIATWNSWFGANLYMPGRKWQPVQLYLSRLLDGMSQYDPEDLTSVLGFSAQQIEKMKMEYMAATRIQYATMLVVALPLLIMYPFVQKDLQQGIMVGSLKE